MSDTNRQHTHSQFSSLALRHETLAEDSGFEASENTDGDLNRQVAPCLLGPIARGEVPPERAYTFTA